MKYFSLLLMLLGVACQNVKTNKQYQKTGTIGDSAMVVTTHPLATQVGLNVLRNGGNAFDAAIAIQFSLAVVYPMAGNIGGGGFAIYRTGNGDIGSLDFREKAPKVAYRDMFLDQDGNVIEDASTLGHKAAGVPGTVDGMIKLHEKFGTIPFANLVQPAISQAVDGVVLTAFDAYNINKYQEAFRKVNRDSIYYLNNGSWKAGDTLYHNELAGTLSFIRDFGREGFYSGIVANQIVAESVINGGFISKEDLADYEAIWRDPLTAEYNGYKIIAMPPPSSGGVALIQLLKGAESYPIRRWGHNTIKTIHLMTELERRVYADRATYLGDPDYVDVPIDMLLSEDYNEERFDDISLKRATPSEDIKQGKVDVIESVETTHFSVVDKWGNAVGITTTLNGYFGCKVLVKGAGFFLNNEMDDFSAKPGVPNMFGLVGAEANAIMPEKRMLSSMTPTIVEKDGKLSMIVGTPGGSTIITSVFQTILNVIDHGMSMQEAIDAPKFHHQWLPDRILYETSQIDTTTITKLIEMGHEVEPRGALGRMDCILIHPNGKIEGASDRRGYGTAMGY